MLVILLHWLQTGFGASRGEEKCKDFQNIFKPVKQSSESITKNG